MLDRVRAASGAAAPGVDAGVPVVVGGVARGTPGGAWGQESMVTFHDPAEVCVTVPLDTVDAQEIDAWLSMMSTTPAPSSMKLAPGNSCTRLVELAFAPDVTLCGAVAALVALTHELPLTTTLCCESFLIRTSGTELLSIRLDA